MRVSPVVSTASKKKQQEKKTHQELEEEAASVRGTSEALTKRSTGPNQTNGKPSRSYRCIGRKVGPGAVFAETSPAGLRASITDNFFLRPNQLSS